MRIEEGASLPCSDVLLKHHAQQVRLPSSRFADDIEMGTAVPLAYAKNRTAAAVIYAAYICNPIIWTAWHLASMPTANSSPQTANVVSGARSYLGTEIAAFLRTSADWAATVSSSLLLR